MPPVALTVTIELPPLHRIAVWDELAATVQAVNVAVIDALPPVIVPLQGVVVPVQVKGAKLTALLQPPNVDPLLGLTVNAIDVLLSEVVIFDEQSLVTV